MDSKHPKHINPLRKSEEDERQSLRGGLFASEEDSEKQDRDKMSWAQRGYGQKMDGKTPGEPGSNRGGLDSSEEMEQKG